MKRISLEECKIKALKYETIIDWIKNDYSTYQSTRRKKWLHLCTNHMINGRMKNLKAKCKVEALKYKSRNQWSKGHRATYEAAYRQNWLDECLPKIKAKWTEEDCFKIAQKFSSKTEWLNNCPSFYFAQKKNILEKCTKHMKPIINSSFKELELLEIIKEKYPSAASKFFIIKNYNNTGKTKKYQLDIFIHELNLGIEFNGDYWHNKALIKKGKNPKIFHKNKKEFFDQLGIRYLEIEEKDWIKNKNLQISNCFQFLNLI